MLKQDARGQAMSKTLCRNMGIDIGRDPFYRVQLVAKLAPTMMIEPTYSVVYLPKRTDHGLPHAWDPTHCGGTWRALPPLDFLPASDIWWGRPQGCSAAQAGLLFFHLNRDDLRRQSGNPTALMRERDQLCVCNPLTRTAVLVTLRRRGFVDIFRTYFAPWTAAFRNFMSMSDINHTVLHARTGAGFTLYDLGDAPKMLRKLHHGAAAAAASVHVGINIVESAAVWETVVRPQHRANDDTDLIMCTKPVVLDKLGVIRSLCMRKVEPEGYQAVFVDYDMGKEEWAEREQAVGGVPRARVGTPLYGDVDMVSLGDTGLWLLHNRLSIPQGLPPAARGAGTAEPSRAIDIYVYEPGAKAFVMVDSAWIPLSAVLAHGGGTSTSTTIVFSVQSTMSALSYDVRTKGVGGRGAWFELL